MEDAKTQIEFAQRQLTKTEGLLTSDMIVARIEIAIAALKTALVVLK